MTEEDEAGRKSLDLCETKLRIETRNSAARPALLERAEAKLARVEAALNSEQVRSATPYGRADDFGRLYRTVRAALADNVEKP